MNDAVHRPRGERPSGALWTQLIPSWPPRRAQHGHARRTDDSIAFLPAALEILEKPPSPAGRWLGYSLMALFALAVAWACIGHVDVVATADGKIIPGGRIKQIQPLQVGVIKALFVTEGERVTQGQPLIELDQTLTGADLARLTREHRYHQQHLLRARALNAVFEHAERDADLTPEATTRLLSQAFAHAADAHPMAIDDTERAQQQAMARRQWLEYLAQQDSFLSQLHNRRAELAAIEANIQKYRSTIPLITKRVNAMAILNEDGIIAEARLLELQEAQVTQQQHLIAEQARRQQVLAALEEVQQNRIAHHHEARNANLETIDRLQQQVDATHQERTKAGEHDAKKILYAPVSGRVQQLAVHTIGGVVQEAQPLMHIVPEARYLEVEATLENKDIGFVHQGQRAEIKIHTFPFTKYGLIDADVVDITADAIEHEQQGLVYTVRLKMANDQLWVDQRWVDLLPGMAVTAEMKTGQRRLITFFLSPLLRYKDESVRER